MAKYSKTQQAEAAERLHRRLSPGATVYTVLRTVARSGMSRTLSVHVVIDGTIRDITHDVATVCGYSLNHRGDIKISGCGMDMGFAVVYALGRALYPGGVNCTGSNGYTPSYKPSKRPRCMSNDHVNPGDQSYRKGRTHRDSGYAFRQVWA